MARLFNFFRKISFERVLKRLINDIESRALDTFLEVLLSAMRLAFFLDKEYRRNIAGFKARYAFKSRDGRIAASAIFDNKSMKVKRHAVGDTNVTIVFKDSESLKDFLFSKEPDVIDAILDNRLTYDGNLNYIAKFAFMAKQLQLKFTP